MSDRRKPDGDVGHDQRAIEIAQSEARRQNKTPAQVCTADHSHIRGRNCGYCGTYFRGDDMG